MSTLKVSSKTNPSSLAGAIVSTINEKGTAKIQTVGAGSTNQAIKAVAIARGYVAPSGFDLIIVPSFADIKIDGEDRTAINLLIEKRNR